MILNPACKIESPVSFKKKKNAMPEPHSKYSPLEFLEHSVQALVYYRSS